ncbi:MAG TPA: MerR family transcriptional regulator [Vicinamibacteria bacterium]|jgi:MerR family Zn(II)-responsive transcriptional regulator of zntA
MARKRLPEKLYRIGEVMEHSGLSRQTLNFYATIGLIREQARTAAGHRLFPPAVFAELERVRGLQKKGYTLRQIREMLDTRHAPRPDAAKTLHSEVFERGPTGE